MNGKKIITWSAIFTLTFGLVVPAASAQTPNRTTAIRQGRGLLKASFRAHRGVAREESLETLDGSRPAWVNQSLARSLTHFDSQKERYGLRDARQELKLVTADQDDLGLTHLRLKQTRNDVEVFGAQLVSHVQGDGSPRVTGRSFDVSAVDTTPTLSAAQAVENAKDALNYAGDFAAAPTAELVVLPSRIFDGKASLSEATLTYQVTLRIEDGTEATATHEYFVGAQDGRIVWHFDSMAKDGPGQSLYNGTVNVPTVYVPGGGIVAAGYKMEDAGHGNSTALEANGRPFESADQNHVWGDGTTNNDESAAVDAQWGVAKAWDYFATVFGRNGWDNYGFEVDSLVHVGSKLNNAFQSGSGSHNLNFGDGDGVTYGPFVSLDVVAHEFTHGVTEHTAGLIYANEPGALNESFSDIFGTATEFAYGASPNYLLGEQIMLPGAAKAVRDMKNPTSLNQPDHYSNLVNPGACTPTSANDYCGVHTNSGIMNNAFYLLAEGGVNGTSKLSVSGIGRRNAEVIYYRALTLYLFPSAKFYDARIATVNAAEDLYGPESKEVRAVEASWDAVGVGGSNLFFYNSNNGSGAIVNVTSDGALKQLSGYGASSFSYGWSAIVPSRNQLFFYQSSSGLYAVAKPDQNGALVTVDKGVLETQMDFVVSTDNSILLVSNESHTGVIGQIDASGKFNITQTMLNAFGTWSKIVDTEYGLFFYNSVNGTVAIGNVSAIGQWSQTFGQANALPTGLDMVAVEGDNILLYNSGSGGYALGVVDGTGKFRRTAISACGASLPSGYTTITAVGSQLFLYNQFTGAAAVGEIRHLTYLQQVIYPGCDNQLSITKAYPAGNFSQGWTKIISTAEGMFFYNFLNGVVAVGHLNADGSFTQTASARYSALWSAIVPTEK
jgi:thermolysin